MKTALIKNTGFEVKQILIEALIWTGELSKPQFLICEMEITVSSARGGKRACKLLRVVVDTRSVR